MKDTASGPKCKLNSRLSPALRFKYITIAQKRKKKGGGVGTVCPTLSRSDKKIISGPPLFFFWRLVTPIRVSLF